MNKNIIVVAVVTAVVAGGGGFLGGIQFQKQKQPAAFRPSFDGQGLPGEMAQRSAPGNNTTRDGNVAFGGRSGIRPVNGEITDIGDNTITVKSPDGSSVLVIYSDTTDVRQTTEGSIGDLAVGETIMVIGQTDTEGTITAQTISVGNEQMRFGQPPVEDAPIPAEK